MSSFGPPLTSTDATRCPGPVPPVTAGLPPLRTLRDLDRRIEGCRACGLHRGRGRPVTSEGPVHADLMIVGDVPRRHEDLQGRPFAGAAANVLDNAMLDAGVLRAEVHLTSVVRCRPEDDRAPTADRGRHLPAAPARPGGARRAARDRRPRRHRDRRPARAAGLHRARRRLPSRRPPGHHPGADLPPDRRGPRPAAGGRRAPARPRGGQGGARRAAAHRRARPWRTCGRVARSEPSRRRRAARRRRQLEPRRWVDGSASSACARPARTAPAPSPQRWRATSSRVTWSPSPASSAPARPASCRAPRPSSASRRRSPRRRSCWSGTTRAALPLVHCDVYRLDRLGDVLELGDEVLAPDVVTFVEWGDAVATLLPDDRWEVDLRAIERAVDGGDGRPGADETARPVPPTGPSATACVATHRGTPQPPRPREFAAARGDATPTRDAGPTEGSADARARDRVVHLPVLGRARRRRTGPRLRIARSPSPPRRVPRAGAAVLPRPGRHRRVDRVGGVAVGLGPGLYTGLRVGIATAQTFAAALDAADRGGQRARRAGLPRPPHPAGHLRRHRRAPRRAVLGALPALARRRPADRRAPARHRRGPRRRARVAR